MKSMDKQQIQRYPIGIGALALLVGLTLSQAAEDRLWRPTCPLFDHPCDHKRAYNPGMCISGVPLCGGAGSQAICLDSNIKYYEVVDDFPQDTMNNITGTCIHERSGYRFEVWREHTNVISPAAPCYALVRCKWEKIPQKCTRDIYISPWYYLPKRQTVDCPW